MPAYVFRLPVSLAGQPASIVTLAGGVRGAEVATGTVGADGAVAATLTAGDYLASVKLAGTETAVRESVASTGDVLDPAVRLEDLSDPASDASVALRAATAAHPVFGTSVPVTIQGLNNGDALAANPQAGGQSQRVPYKAAIDCTDLRLVFTMWASGSNVDSAPNGAVSFKAAIEYNGVTYPLTFDGQRTVSADPWSMKVSDALGLELAAGDTFYVRSWFNTVASGTYPLAVNLNGAAGLGLAGSWVNGSDVCDATGAMSGTNAAPAWAVFGPAQVLGTPLGARKPSVLFIGDSLTLGIGDQQTGGFGFRALAATPVPAHVVAMPGGTLATLVGKQGHARVGPFLPLGAYPFSMMGTNDLDNGTANRTADQLAQDFLTLGKMLIARGVRNKLTIGTLIPRTTTGAGTTTVPSNSKRLVFNAWVRAGCPMDPATGLRVAPGTSGAILAGSASHPIKGYVEIADAVETARDSGLFKNGYTSEGTHLSAAGADAAKPPVQAWLAGLPA
jgi:lysophospholipase L1-like esterase